MPPLICPSPILVDHSFPRDDNELRRAAVALGELAGLLEQGEIELLLTVALEDLLSVFDAGSGDRPYSLIHDIHGLLDTLMLNTPDGVVRVNLDSVEFSTKHPIPESCSDDGLVDLWSEEMGKLLSVHDNVQTGTGFFIGVACDLAFSGQPLGKYRPPPTRALPLVGPTDMAALESSCGWSVLPATHGREVSFAQVIRNIHLLGATEVRPPGSGSHYMVSFPGTRPWPLDKNVDPLPDRFLKQLIDKTGYALPVIKSVLVSGRKPRSVCLLSRWIVN